MKNIGRNIIKRQPCKDLRRAALSGTYVTLRELMSTIKFKRLIKHINLWTRIKIIKIYFRIMMHWILEGYVWELPLGTGTMKIVKKSIASQKDNKGFMKRHHRIMKSKKSSHNLSRIGYYYKIVTEGFLVDKGLVFETPRIMKIAMRDKIVDEGKDYRYEE